MNDSGRSSAVFLVLTLLLLGGAGLSAWVLLARDSAQDLPIVDPAPANGAAGQTPVVPPVTAGAEVASEHQAENASAAPTMLELPDGTAMPNLNGVKIKVNFLWPQDRPYSPIVGKREARNANEWEWYEHADGTMSTTAMVFRSDLGRKDATSVVASPTPGVPLDPELAQQMYEEGMLGTNPGQKPTK